MADTTTTNYSLTKPEVGASSDSWGEKLNANADTLDSTIKTVSDVASAAVVKASNLGDLASASTALTNLNITATAAELNRSNITTEGTVEASKVVTADASGNITVPATKTIDGRDISVDGTKLDNIDASANLYELPAATTLVLGGAMAGSGLQVSTSGTNAGKFSVGGLSSTHLATNFQLTAANSIASTAMPTGSILVSNRVCVWEGSNGTTTNGVFDAPTSGNQGYSLTPSATDQFNLSSGTLLRTELEFECVSDEDGFVVGDLINSTVAYQFINSNVGVNVWHTHGGDFSNTDMRIKFNTGGSSTQLFYLYEQPSSTSGAYYLHVNWAVYARLYYTP